MSHRALAAAFAVVICILATGNIGGICTLCTALSGGTKPIVTD